ncbi:MAG TPA: hypothetical protein VER11_34555 [Polyangiaceae bacterium]|nr:hypothetical protein [Polyangiaceae bacterium]
MTRDAFLTLYSQFSTLDPDIVEAQLAETLLGLDATVYGARLDAAHGALTAHELWVSPAGMPLRGESDQAGTSDFLTKFQRIRRECAPKFMVL